MRAFDFINPFRDFLNEFAAFLKQQNERCQADSSTYHPNLITINTLYLLNIAHTLEKLDTIYNVLKAHPSHTKATLKLFDYAARTKLALQRTLRSAQLKVAVHETYHTQDTIRQDEAKQCETLFKKFQAIASNIVNDLPLPQKQWLNQDLLSAELQYHETLSDALLKGSKASKEFAEEILLVERLQNTHILPHLNMTGTTFGYLQETKNKIPTLKARL